jgi:Lantibiotic dehydratase, N terminus
MPNHIQLSSDLHVIKSPAIEFREEPAAVQKDDHLVSIPSLGLNLWRWAGLRSAGFPFADVLRLAAPPDFIRKVDAVLKSAQAVEDARQRAHASVDSALDELRSAEQWSDKTRRNALLNARMKINAGKVSGALREVNNWPVIAELRTAISVLNKARDAYRELFAGARKKNSETICEIASSAAFREALTWQNRAALRTALDPILHQAKNGSSRGSPERQHEELVASYWQRYCAKNDTIGFFGPVAWAQFALGMDGLAMKPGKQVIGTRKVYWEAWPIQALAKIIIQKEGVRQCLPPILMPMLRLESTILCHPRFGRVQLSEEEAALLHACNGCDTASQIAARVLRSPGLGFASEEEVYAKFREWAEKGYISWRFNITSGPHPERILRDTLKQIEDLDIRNWALGLLNTLEDAKAQVEAADGDVDHLNATYQNLESAFTRITGTPPLRHQGRIYAGRTLLYLDCRRDVEVQLGEELLRSLSEPLSFVLASARWFSRRVAERYGEELRKIHSELARSQNDNSVDAVLYFAKVAPILSVDAHSLVTPLEEELRSKWDRVLQLDSSREAAAYSCDELRPRIEQEFPSGPAGWLGARYHSPDIMIAAASPEAVRRGEYFFVLGELHMAMNTLSASLFVSQHPFPEELIAAVRRDLGDSYLLPVMPVREFLGSRTAYLAIPKSTYRLEYTDEFVTDRSRVLSLSSLVIENHNNDLVVRTRDGKFRMSAIDMVGWLITLASANGLKGAIAPRRHTPRISIGKLVIKRESWQFSASELHFAQGPDSAERFLQIRTWAQRHGIPRFAFFKTPGERQPAFIDFDSPLLADIFAKLVRRTLDAEPGANIEITEMLPAGEQLWLADADNRRYTSEFRFIAVDPEFSGRDKANDL